MSGGDLDTVRELAEKNLVEMERFEADFVMSACATCSNALHRLYPLAIGKRNPQLKARLEALAAKTVDASQLLHKLGLNPAETGAGEAMRITYHDPCHLRTRGVTGQPRQLLRAVPDLELAEMEAPDSCCGLGGTFNVYHYDSSMAINEAKSRAIINTAAQVVATGCPGCMMQLSDGLKQNNSTTKVSHTLEILARNISKTKS
jgi:glycolate oxidase iron-sulfur subunit